jgi:hypothetical protein
MAAKKDPAVAALARASKGLVFPSETDAPFVPFQWRDGDGLTDAHLLELAGEKPGTPVEVVTLADFLRVIPPRGQGGVRRASEGHRGAADGGEGLQGRRRPG